MSNIFLTIFDVLALMPDTWTPIMRIIEDSTFGYTSPLWTNDDLLNENSNLTDNVNAKYASFLSAPFNTIRMCSQSVDSNCVSYTFENMVWNSAKDLFNSGYQQAPDQDQAGILAVFGPKKGDYKVFTKPKYPPYFTVSKVKSV